MNVIDAAHKTVHNPKHGGSTSLSARMGMTTPVLNSKVNSSNTTHHLRLDEALTIMEFTNDDAIIQAMAHQLGGVYCKVDATSNESDLLMTALFSTSCQGDVMANLTGALSDGFIDCKEADKLQQAIQSAMSMLAAFNEQVKAYCGGDQ